MSNLHMRTECLQRALAYFFFQANLLIEMEVTNQEISLIASYRAAHLECLPKFLSVWVSVHISDASELADRLVTPHEKWPFYFGLPCVHRQAQCLLGWRTYFSVTCEGMSPALLFTEVIPSGGQSTGPLFSMLL